MKLYNRSGKDICELPITAENLFKFSLNGHSVKIQVFVQHESKIPCFIGLNISPHIGL